MQDWFDYIYQPKLTMYKQHLRIICFDRTVHLTIQSGQRSEFATLSTCTQNLSANMCMK